jgi:hypothetical protein
VCLVKARVRYGNQFVALGLDSFRDGSAFTLGQLDPIRLARMVKKMVCYNTESPSLSTPPRSSGSVKEMENWTG